MSASTDPQTNSRGIPQAPFVDDVEKFVDSREEIETNLKKFQEMIAQYQFMEVNTERRGAALRDKIPDIQKTLDTVSFLKGRKSSSKPFEATFELNDTLYARANIPATEEVYLWLGANVMLSYPIDEAATLLKGKLDAAKESLRNCEEDMDFLRQQITTLEVNTARLYNYEVTLKRKEREEAEREEKGKKGGK
ncbi:Prefoldin, subunit 3 [Choiromyces venosus 120613-1]|uniref:Prefoldin subunit 3 n=1 Tax=Choiromyces venosus 120613-1 TaxID=1336337 RepID=A0A3N4JL89_9PEZI|nr:Prefoldin, subunit 3 [Choiromyces venosus 120613-1]